MGLLDRRPGYYRVKITLTVLAFFAGWALFVIVGNSWAALAVAPLLGFTFTQLGFIGHDAGHNQVFGTRRRNRLLGFAVGNALIGLSFGWWVPKHNAHHDHPNEIGLDPDIGEGSALPASDAPGEGQGHVASWLARWQAPLFFPLMLLRSSGMHVLGISRLARRRDRASAVEASLLALHAALYLTVVLLVLSPLKALAFLVVQQAVFSLYLGVSFAPNHKGMPIIESATEAGFARRQVVTARNVTGGRLTTFMLGGLNYQIEHHLFPSMPRPNLRRVQGLVRDFCAATRPRLQRRELRRDIPPDHRSPERCRGSRQPPAARRLRRSHARTGSPSLRCSRICREASARCVRHELGSPYCASRPMKLSTRRCRSISAAAPSASPARMNARSRRRALRIMPSAAARP